MFSFAWGLQYTQNVNVCKFLATLSQGNQGYMAFVYMLILRRMVTGEMFFEGTQNGCRWDVFWTHFVNFVMSSQKLDSKVHVRCTSEPKQGMSSQKLDSKLHVRRTSEPKQGIWLPMTPRMRIQWRHLKIGLGGPKWLSKHPGICFWRVFFSTCIWTSL